MDTLSLRVLGCNVQVQCQDAEARTLLVVNYGYMQGPPAGGGLQYVVGRAPRSSAFVLQQAGQTPRMAADAGEFLRRFGKDMTIELQKLRCDLYFVHSAVLEWGGAACLLVAPSGSGKSTLTWALAHHGLGYLSDELAPIDLQTLEVYPYPHALCLKQAPTASYPLPAQCLSTARAFYIPPAQLPSGVSRCAHRVMAIFFVHYSPQTVRPAVRRLSSAAAGARLFANALNPLAHGGEGLDGALALATQSACFALDTAALPATCALVTATLDGLRSRHERYPLTPEETPVWAGDGHGGRSA